ncbi:hypothetical protein M3Y99_00487600 [Aphelenchoides fujianensis]|nr:hypothetical protein M3Y99_00487600 [Aphelenchoides fujianensis]
MSVDYSTQDFQRSRAVIDAAARQTDNVRVRQIGDTTIMTEHRDPYSFYWQLDQVRRKEAETPRPPRQPPLTDYVRKSFRRPAVLSPDSHDSGVNLESQYSRPLKEEVRQLPAGWEKHEDPSGFSYYWHVDSGTIQREPPPIIEEHAFKQITTKTAGGEPRRRDERRLHRGGFAEARAFAVRSLGWTEIAEDDLTADRSSRAVNRAIIELSNGSRPDVPKWGNGKELIMELNDNELLLVDPESLQNVHSEKIQQIRVWGVGRDNGRDFAYVARDPKSRRFLCHVFPLRHSRPGDRQHPAGHLQAVDAPTTTPIVYARFRSDE